MLPVTGLDQSLLVIDYDFKAGMPASSSPAATDSLAALKTLVTDPALHAANVTRLVMIFQSTDQKGPFVLTASLPMSALAGLADGTLSSKDVEGQLLLQVKREGAP